MSADPRPADVGAAPFSARIDQWLVCSSRSEGSVADGREVSRPDYPASGWLVAPARSTVMAALLANGRYPEIERSTNLRELVDPADFVVPWWYRACFDVDGEARTALRLEGVIQSADLFVNGAPIATAHEIAGAYAVSSFEVTTHVQRGANALALRVYPGHPLEDLTINWWDWNQPPPDFNLGIWRDLVIERTGAIRIDTPLVTSRLPLPALSPADLEISIDVSNLSEETVEAELTGAVHGHSTQVPFRRRVTLAPRSRATVTVDRRDVEGLRIEDPALWWPIGEGAPDRYELDVAALVDGEPSDRRTIAFGIRTVTSRIEPGGGRRFVVNGRPLQIVGGGWSPDLFLRHDPERTAAELSYVADLGHNAVRLEGKLETPEFFDMTDSTGIMVLAGWECCSKWEEKGPEGSPWTEQDFEIARRSMESEAALLRHHPSVIGFLIGSDFAPPPRTAETYVDALHRARWDLPIISAAASAFTEAAGPSAMKMTGPYSWVPPSYWYSRDERRGGATGFNSETGSGGTIPRLSNLIRMLSEDELDDLWRTPDAKQFHAGPPSEFDNLGIFHRALAGRYGAIKSLRDFVRKAQLANYEAARAQFEAYRSRAFAPKPATGLIYWLLNSAWPSLNWQLYDWYLDPGGSYFGAKKACEPIHVFYAYDSSAIAVANHHRDCVGPFVLSYRIVAMTGRATDEGEIEIAKLAPLEVVKYQTVSPPRGEEATFFVSLELKRPDGASISRNVYWLSSVPDVLDWDASTWQYTPTVSYADLTGLERLPVAQVDSEVERLDAHDDKVRVRVRIKNPSDAGTPAVGVHAAFCSGGDEDEGPRAVLWSDNDVTLFAGDEVVLGGTRSASPGREVAIRIDGFNLGSSPRVSA